MIHPRIIPFVLLLAATQQQAAAQTMHLIARQTTDSVVLRWAPNNVVSWERNNQFGYKVERMAMPRELVGRPPVERLTPDTLRPWPLEVMRARFAADHQYAPIAAQALYGGTFAAAPTIADMATIADASNELMLRYSFALLCADLDAATATALGLRWVDRDVDPRTIYLYRVIALDPEHPDTAMMAVNRNLGADLPDIGPTPQAEEQDGQVMLQWRNDLTQGAFTAFWIERKGSGGQWERLNGRPFLQASANGATRDADHFFTDTTIAGNYVAYQYRVRGISPFGETSEPSSAITAMGRDRSAPPNPVMKEVKDEHGKLVVYWEQPEGAADLLGFRVEKAYAANDVYHPLHTALLPISARSFTDTSNHLLGENHYRVFAVDTAGNASVSLSAYGFLVDSIPPATPVGLIGSIDTTGVVTLRWRMGPEPDIQGYRVFFANQADHEFSNLTPLPHRDTLFTDTITLQTLTRRIHYRIVAVDRNFNHSGMSAMLTLARPDTIRPVSPLFSNYSVTDSSVVLHFIPSSSPDVARYDLFRTTHGTDTTHRIATWNGMDGLRSYADRHVTGPKFYSYSIQVVDSAGNISGPMAPLEVRVRAPLKVASVPKLDAVLDEDTRTVRLTWTPPLGEVNYFVVYRARDDASPLPIASVQGVEQNWTDKRMTSRGAYRYLLKAVYTNGSASPLVESTTRVVVP